MAQRFKACKQRVLEPVRDWKPLSDFRVVYYGLERVADVQTTGGDMTRVRLTLKADLCRPGTDVAALVGTVRRADLKDPDISQGPELWFWGDDYWLKGRNPAGGEWYKDQSYLLYRVTVFESPGFLEGLTEMRELAITAAT